MTIARALVMLEGCKADITQSAARWMGKANLDIYDPHLKSIAESVVDRYYPGKGAEIWKQYRPLGRGFVMKFRGGIENEGDTGTMDNRLRAQPTAPSGDTWEEWDDMNFDERLLRLSDETIESWIEWGFKDLTFADQGLLERHGTPALAQKVRNVITGGVTHGGQPDLFFGNSKPGNLADFAGVYDGKRGHVTQAMLLEILALWMKFMLTEEEGVVRNVARELQNLTAKRVIQN